MNDNADEDINEDSHVDADTSLADLDIKRLNSIKTGASNEELEVNVGNGQGIVIGNDLLKRTSDNLAIAEARVDEKPIRTEKTEELEKREEDNKE